MTALLPQLSNAAAAESSTWGEDGGWGAAPQPLIKFKIISRGHDHPQQSAERDLTALRSINAPVPNVTP